jgi:hypothetical protein
VASGVVIAVVSRLVEVEFTDLTVLTELREDFCSIWNMEDRLVELLVVLLVIVSLSLLCIDACTVAFV